MRTRFLIPLLSVALGIALGLLVVALVGESPLKVLTVLSSSAFGSWYDFGMTLFYSVPLIFTGLSVAIAYHAGLFNIGAEGQLTVGALATAAIGVGLSGLPWPVAPIAAISAAFLAGALWGGIAGWLRAYRGSHEVITTIMMNFIAASLTTWFALYVFPNPNSQNPETAVIAQAFVLPKWQVFGDAPVGFALPLALMTALATFLFLWRTIWGFELRAVGQSERAARVAGIDVARTRVLAMILAGGLAGLVAAAEVLGNSWRFKVGFSPHYGFIGIAVALLAQGHPGGVVAAALLFGALHKGTADLDFETERVSRDLSLVLQALVIFSVSARALWEALKRRLTGVTT